MVFCNEYLKLCSSVLQMSHNPYFNRWFSAIQSLQKNNVWGRIVTILILIDGFLQSKKGTYYNAYIVSHNPYFNRWFSAIYSQKIQY